MSLGTAFSSVSIIGRVIITSIALSIIYLFYGPPDYVEMDLINEAFYILIVAPVLIIATIFYFFFGGYAITC